MQVMPSALHACSGVRPMLHLVLWPTERKPPWPEQSQVPLAPVIGEAEPLSLQPQPLAQPRPTVQQQVPVGLSLPIAAHMLPPPPLTQCIGRPSPAPRPPQYWLQSHIAAAFCCIAAQRPPPAELALAIRPRQAVIACAIAPSPAAGKVCLSACESAAVSFGVTTLPGARASIRRSQASRLGSPPRT